MPLIGKGIQNASEHHAAINMKVGVLSEMKTICKMADEQNEITREQSMLLTFEVPAAQKEINESLSRLQESNKKQCSLT